MAGDELDLKFQSRLLKQMLFPMKFLSPDSFSFTQCILRVALFLLASAGFSTLDATTTLPSAQGSLSDPNALAPTTQAAPEDFVHGLINLEFSDHHLTPRGINLENKGLIAQPLLRLDWNLYEPKPAADQAIDEVTLTTAMWNDVDTHRSGASPGNWNETDPTIGPNVKFLKDWTFESPFIAFVSETASYPTCWAWDPRLTYHDHFIKNFSFNPYVEFFDELQNKITVVLSPATSQPSYYGVIGMDPTYVFQDIPLKLELPTYCLIPGKNFYQRADGTGGGTDLGLFSTMLKATVPLQFISPSYGKWSIYAGVQYDYLNNPGLLDGNEIAGAAMSRERSVVIFHGGITFRF